MHEDEYINQWMHDNKYINQWMHGNEYINQWMHADEWRDPRYDNYINSHECLINPSAVFLTQYSHILRYFYYYILSLIHLSMCFVYIISYSYFFIHSTDWPHIFIGELKRHYFSLVSRLLVEYMTTLIF